MTRRPYRLGHRQASADQTAGAILEAARILLSEGSTQAPSVGAVARRAGVSRLTIYNRFGSRAGLLEAAVRRPEPFQPAAEDPREALRILLQRTSAGWAVNPGLYRHLKDESGDADGDRRLAERLTAADALRPGCSLKEAQDVIGVLSSFSVFQRLHQDGRRSPTAVAEILMRMAGGILA